MCRGLEGNQSELPCLAQGKTSAVRPRKQPYNPRSGSSKADRQAPMAFGFGGLDIRHRLPDAKRSTELLKAPGGAHLSIEFRHPRTVSTRLSPIIGHTSVDGNGTGIPLHAESSRNGSSALRARSTFALARRRDNEV
jgi:hypothetical protein